jgi:hypothetical protein
VDGSIETYYVFHSRDAGVVLLGTLAKVWVSENKEAKSDMRDVTEQWSRISQ